MPTTTAATLTAPVRENAHPLTGAAVDYDPLMDRIGDARFVLLGEASHGTHEFYHERAEITKRLIREKGFIAVAVEADWPDAYRVNRYVRGVSDDMFGIDALADFRRFPTWMWRNTDVVEFVEWLRAHNDGLPSACGRQWKRCSAISKRSIPSRPIGCALGMPASITLGRTPRPMGS